jgi:hypothetical protein
MYGKLFASTYTGSLYGAGPDLFALWGYVVANSSGGQVELNPVALAPMLGMPVERVEAVIAALCAPDPRSRSKAEDGRRLIREGQFAYRVVNAALYRSIRNEDDRREYNREKQREHRARKSKPESMTVIDSQSLSTLSAHTEAEAETETIPTGSAEPEAPPAVDNPSRTGWKADAAVVLREAGVPAKEVGDAIRTFWTAARSRFTDPEIAELVRDQGRRMKGQAWNPSRVWNPNNADFDERFRYAMSQVRGRAARDRSASKGLAQVRDVLARATERR